MDVIDTTLQVNKFARINRHLKIFSRWSLLKIYLSNLLNLLTVPARLLNKAPFFVRVIRLLSSIKLFTAEILPVSPQRKLFFQAVIIAGAALIITSLTPGGTLTAASIDYSYNYISAYSVPGDVLVSDEDGYLIKMNPQTNDSNRIGLTDYAVHTIESGESLSLIAQRYGVGVETIMWENNIVNANNIRTGQKLLIPPVDGISYTVAAGETLEKIANRYKVSVDAIIAQNTLESETIQKGQLLFIPGAQPIKPVSTIAADYRVSSVSRAVNYADVSASSATPAVGRVFIFPTTGKVTQSYRAGHYAIDISDTSRPPIWAAGAGTVTKVSTGTWGGGYGNHIIIDHGNGLQTLYAHLDSVNVYEGQWVNQGDVIGIMGNTGRVYGKTGIHLHWEVIQDGVKQYPGDYY